MAGQDVKEGGRDVQSMTAAEMLCGFFGRMPGDVPFLPETWRAGAASVWLSGGGEVLRSYIDGSAVLALPFEIRLRCAGRCIGDRLDVLDFYRRMDLFIRQAVPEHPAFPGAVVEPAGGVSRASVYDNGEEEYRASFRLRWFSSEGGKGAALWQL